VKIGKRWLLAAAQTVRGHIQRNPEAKNLKVDIRGLADRIKREAIASREKERRMESRQQSRPWSPIPGSKCPIKPCRRLPRYILAGANRVK
jgi:hypothetical protein